MRNLFITLFLTATYTIVTAQNLRGSYQPKADGLVKKQQVEFSNAKALGQGVVWDFSQMELPNEGYNVKYTLAEHDSQDSIIAGTEQRTRYYYRSTADSIMLCGYENNLTKVEYDRPELLLHMPLVYGSRHDGLFHGSAVYCEREFLRVFGSYQVEVDGTGSMLLPSGDTLRHVSRVHIRKLTAQQHYPHVMTGNELKLYIDSIAPYTSDSIRLHLATDTLLTETNTYCWYAAGYRYPIVESIAVGERNAAPDYTVSYYCSPDEQSSDDENEQIRLLLAEIDSHDGRRNGENHEGESNNSNNPQNESPMHNTSVKVNGMTITVNYDLTADATVNALVCDIAGMVYRSNSLSGQAANSYQLSIDCSGLHHGQYVLYLKVNGQVTSQTISI